MIRPRAALLNIDKVGWEDGERASESGEAKTVSERGSLWKL